MPSWTGLGINTSHSAVTSRFQEYLDDFENAGISFIRMSLPDYLDTDTIALAKEDILEAKNRSFNVIAGLSSNPTALTATNWDTFATAVESFAIWCQSNGVNGFIIGNEEESHNTAESVTSLERASNVATVTFAYTHGFVTGETVTIAGANEAGFNGNGIEITGTTDTTFTYASVASDDTATGTITAKLSSASLRSRLRTLATSCKALFTNGDIHYSVATNSCEGWISDDDLGDIDQLGLNIYLNNKLSDGSTLAYPGLITSLLTAFTSSNAYISEFSLDSTSLGTYNDNEYIQTVELANMQNTIKSLGITRAYFFKYLDTDFGILSSYGADYRLIWNVLKSNNGRWSFIN